MAKVKKKRFKVFYTENINNNGFKESKINNVVVGGEKTYYGGNIKAYNTDIEENAIEKIISIVGKEEGELVIEKYIRR